MKRFFMWILMVLLFIALIVGGALGFLYVTAGEDDLPKEQAALGQTVLVPNGYSWKLPVLGGIRYRNYSSSPSLGAQDLGTVDQQGASLHLPPWATGAQIELKQGDQVVFSGNAEEYTSFAWPADGDYRISVIVLGDEPDVRPARPLGGYSYSAKFNMQRQLTATLSDTKLYQGGVFAIYVQGGSMDVQPTVNCELGNAWFAPYAAGWIGFLPVAHNAESGTYPLEVIVGDRVLPLEVTVIFRQFDKGTSLSFGNNSDEAAAEYRREIWPLYSSGAAEKRWNDAFCQPVQGSILLDYGVYLSEGGRSSGITFGAEAGSEVVSPADGQVVFSAPLALTGNTMVVEHGCGVKSYFYHLDSPEVTVGTTVNQGQLLGRAGGTPLIYELKIGNKSIDPWQAWKGTSGLFYRPQFAE